MAWYCPTKMWYRGRLWAIDLRYGSYDGGGGARLVKGKPLKLTKRDHARIETLVERKPATHRRISQFCDWMNSRGL